MKKNHSVKIAPKYFNLVLSGEKTFEIRFNDRDYKQGEIIILNEYDPINLYSGRKIEKQIGFVTDFEQKKGYCVLSLLPANSVTWSIEELIAVNDFELTHSQAAKKINRSVNSVFSKRRKLGIIEKCKGYRDPNLNRFTEGQDKLIKNCKKGKLKKLSNILKKPYSVVWARQQILKGNY